MNKTGTESEFARIRGARLFALMAIGVIPTFASAEVEFTRVGNPVWEPVGGYISAIDVDADPDLEDPQEQRVFLSNALGSHYVTDDDYERLYPVEPHDAPYDRSYREAIARAGGFESDSFVTADMRGPDRLYRGITWVPSAGGPTGAAIGNPDTPILPADIFPITSTWVTEYRERDGNVVDLIENCPGCQQPTETLSLGDYGLITDENGGQRDYTGLHWDHLHYGNASFWKRSSATSNAPGEYESVFEFRDAQGNGWDVNFFYSVIPRPTRVDGDISYDNELDVHDLNILVHNLALGSTNDRLDLNDDETIDLRDVHFWVSDLKKTWIGDANLDGEFNSGDFVQVFQAGKYESDELSIWSEGDWNADERFDSGDFVVAFQDGGYEMGVRSTVATVPEPTTGWFAVIAVLSIACRRFRQE